MPNKVVFGLKNVYVAMLTDEAVPTYDAPEAIPGSVDLGFAPQGDTSIFYADNSPYYTSTQNNGYTGDLKMALVPDAILAAILNWEVDENGLLVEIADALPAPFALLFEAKGDAADKRYVFYKCVAARPKEEHATTTEKADPATTALTVTIMPITIDDVVVVKSGVERTEANAAIFDAWYDSVTLPSYAVS